MCIFTPIKNLWNRYIERTQERISKGVEKYGEWAVAIFIGIPLPGSGVYTGAVASFLIGLNFKKFLVNPSFNVHDTGVEVNATMSGIASIDELVINVDCPERVTKGDTFDIKCQINQDISDWKIRCEIYDNYGHSIKLANSLSGGSDDQIEVVSNADGLFTIRVAKDLTTNFDTKCFIEIEVENTSEQIFTVWRYGCTITDQQIDWTDPSS